MKNIIERMEIELEGKKYKIVPVESKIPVYIVSPDEFYSNSGICVGDRVVVTLDGELRHIYLRPKNAIEGYSVGFTRVEFEFDRNHHYYEELGR